MAALMRASTAFQAPVALFASMQALGWSSATTTNVGAGQNEPFDPAILHSCPHSWSKRTCINNTMGTAESSGKRLQPAAAALEAAFVLLCWALCSQQ